MLGSGRLKCCHPVFPGLAYRWNKWATCSFHRTNFATGGTTPYLALPHLRALNGSTRLPGRIQLSVSMWRMIFHHFKMRMPMGGGGNVKYSIGAAGAVPTPYSPADIISPALPFGVPWAPAGALGLMPADDIDALITQDIGPAAMYMPASTRSCSR